MVAQKGKGESKHQQRECVKQMRFRELLLHLDISSPSRRSISIHLSPKCLLRTPEAHHEVYGFTSSTNRQKQPIRSSWGNSPPLSRLPKMAYRFLAIAGNQRTGVQQLPPVHYTFYRVDPPEGCVSVKMQFDGYDNS
ncbi:hypothetical protein J6590_022810 [Homalodisca vitripennis]|nr:hypothetical protein J6590_022810 [Homalodisca vitripennis]